MSVFSITALDRLIDSDRRSSSISSETMPAVEKQNMAYREGRPMFVSYPYSSTTSASPSPRPRSPSPTSFSPSPYIVNHKRRVPNGLDSKRTSQQNGFHVSDNRSVNQSSVSQELLSKSGKENGNSQEGLSNGSTGAKQGQDRSFVKERSISPQSSLTLQLRDEKASDGGNADDKSWFRTQNFDQIYSDEEKSRGKRLGGVGRRETSSRNDDPRGKKKLEDGPAEGSSSRAGNASSSARPSEVSRFDSRTSSSTSSEEWFDAQDGVLPDYLSDDDSRRKATSSPGPSSRGDPDSNLILQLKAEIQRRIVAEEAREALQQQRDGMAQMLSSAGISVPQSDMGNVKLTENDKVVGISYSESQRLMVARYVAGAVATGAVRAEAEAELQTVLAEKSREIARLKDKLQYYELVNHEMSQRNQESIENARQSRRRRQRIQRFVVLGLSAAICVGVSAAAVYHYVPWENVKDLSDGSILPEGEQLNPSSVEQRDRNWLCRAIVRKGRGVLSYLKGEEHQESRAKPVEHEVVQKGDCKMDPCNDDSSCYCFGK